MYWWLFQLYVNDDGLDDGFGATHEHDINASALWWVSAALLVAAGAVMYFVVGEGDAIAEGKLKHEGPRESTLFTPLEGQGSPLHGSLPARGDESPSANEDGTNTTTDPTGGNIAGHRVTTGHLHGPSDQQEVPQTP